ncbi:MAG: hypothetical protein HZY73_11210 [Micropruina sp.]|nr:MAG: hypothetical protein HZY73_11210 [Micropruina sp.]
MTRLLAIDPGNELSAYVVIDADYRPVALGKVPNDELLDALGMLDLDVLGGAVPTAFAIEMVASYGMPVGREVFETCYWIGRFSEAIRAQDFRHPLPELVYRREVKLNICGSAKAKDGNIRQALVDRFAPGRPNHGKGTKAAPGWFYGFSADIWQAYALAVTHLDHLTRRDERAPF